MQKIIIGKDKAVQLANSWIEQGMEVDIEPIEKVEDTYKVTTKNKQKTKIQLNIKPLKRALPFAIAIMFIFVAFATFVPPILAASPVVAYSSIGDGEHFVDVIPGEGVNLTVNVSDSDTDIQSVIISSNSSGTWQTFYNSGPLGGVGFHNTSQIVNYDWTGSWETYYFNVTVNDGSDYDFVYSFTTEYVFGEPQMIHLDDTSSDTHGVMLKNNTNDYYLWYKEGDNLNTKTSDNPTNFILKPPTLVYGGIYDGPYNSFTYNNMPHVYYTYGSLYTSYYDGIWNSVSSGIAQHDHYSSYTARAYGADVKYFDGQWHFVAGHASGPRDVRLYCYISSNPTGSFSYTHDFEGYSYNGDNTAKFYPSLCIYNSTLHLAYHDAGRGSSDDLKWYTYDGSSWAYKGTLADNIDDGGVSLTADRANNQMVLAYISGDNKLYYRIYNGTTWSDPQLVFRPEAGKDIGNLHIFFIDARLIITFGNTLRGTSNLYSITAPDYVSTSGVGRLNHIEFPDSAPNAQHVNSSVFATKNINPRNILNITWHFEDIGDVNISNNLIVWSNMTGTWTNSWAVDGVGNTSKIDISAVKGSEWQAGESLYWKIEILDVGPVPETLHTTDEDIYMLIDLI